MAQPRGEQAEPNTEQVQEAENLMEQAKQIGPWDNQVLLIENSWDRMFEKNNWNSESDQYTRQLLSEVNRIPPWEPMKREEVFVNSIQTRYGLTHDQAALAQNDLRRESIMVAIKHFRTLMPIASEFMQARAKNEPFTAEQVADWSMRLQPVADDALAAVQRIGDRLDATLTPEQRAIFKKDMDALLRRHHDVVNSMRRWADGQWDPREWGLDDDPAHALAMMEVRRTEQERAALVENASNRKGPPNDKNLPTTDSAWDKYVRWFCNHYQCDHGQQVRAASILKSSKEEAFAYRKSRKDMISRLERQLATAETEDRRTHYQAEQARMLAPIGEVFHRMCRRLDEQLTRAQRLLRPVDSTGSAVPNSAAANASPPRPVAQQPASPRPATPSPSPQPVRPAPAR